MSMTEIEPRELNLNYEKRVLGELLDEIDSLEGHKFEYYCAELLRKCKYINVSVTPGSNDQGADIVAEKDSIKYAFQCKRVNSHLNNKCVQEISVGRAFYKCDIGIVLTNNYFNEHAKMAASATGVLLWDREKLISLLKDSGIVTLKATKLRELDEKAHKATEEKRKADEEQFGELRENKEDCREFTEQKRDDSTITSETFKELSQDAVSEEKRSEKISIDIKNVVRKLIFGYAMCICAFPAVIFSLMVIPLLVVERDILTTMVSLMLGLDFIILDRIMFIQFKKDATVKYKFESVSKKQYTIIMLKLVAKITIIMVLAIFCYLMLMDFAR